MSNTQAGDILFYRPGNFLEDIVQMFEGGKGAFVHCAIAIAPTRKIEAVPDGGVVLSSIGRTPDGIFHSSYQDVQVGIAWLKMQIGQMYSYIDCVDAILASFERNVLIPSKWYDCSALATEFLMKAGGVELGNLTADVHTVTPQELANQLKVL